jgi:hypothetical protein
MPECYEASITTLENTKDLSKITLAELINALQAQEQRRLMRQDRVTEGALQAKYPDSDKKNQVSNSSKTTVNQFPNKAKFLKRNFPPCQHCNKLGHPPFKSWKDLMQNAVNVIKWDMKQSSAKQNFRNRMKMLRLPVKMMKIKCL